MRSACFPKFLLLLMSATMMAETAPGQLARATVEKPVYEVLLETDDYELRKYPACIVAQVKIPETATEAMSQGFRPLADYIFGNNVSSKKVAMTSPVTQEVAAPTPTGESEKIAMTSPVVQETAASGSAGNSHHLVQFIMPTEYTLETLPTPKNPDVTLAAKEARTYAVVRFSGRGNDEQMREKEVELRASLERDKLSIAGPVQYARYDPPWTLPPLRRNEVMIPIVPPTGSDADAKPYQASEARETTSP